MIKRPSKATLRKYGITEMAWEALAFSQSYRCPICGREFSEKVRPVIDHLHVKQWKKKAPAERAKFVRGVVCVYCNFRVLTKNMTLERARNAVRYLEAYEARLLSEKSVTSL